MKELKQPKRRRNLRRKHPTPPPWLVKKMMMPTLMPTLMAPASLIILHTGSQSSLLYILVQPRTPATMPLTKD
eukprot:6062017-Pleurochrysis_carterae.AAC.1